MKLIKPIFTNDYQVVISLQDKYGLCPYFIEIEIKHDDSGFPYKCEIVEFCPTKLPLDETRSDISWDWYIKWGGYPNFIHGEAIPVSDDGIPYTYLCTVENGWGDSGNCNIFLLLKDGLFGLKIDDVYMEASCH